jgi:hypothetical protein
VGPPSPLSGRPAPANLPVLAVKIDNVIGAFPQAGVNDADIVYVEQVEGGLTRLLAVFSSRLPAQVGPVRSARTDNVELLAQFGKPEIAFSGANAFVLSAVRNSTLRDADPDIVPAAYQRVSDHVAPHNLFANPRVLVKAKPGSPARSIGLKFDNTTPAHGLPASEVTVRYPQAQLTFTYDKLTKVWRLAQDGAKDPLEDGVQRKADTVVVQRVHSGVDYDPITPYNNTVGSGSATVFRDGRAIQGTWKRATKGSGTTFLDKNGQVIPVRVGTTWILVLPDDGSVSGKS